MASKLTEYDVKRIAREVLFENPEVEYALRAANPEAARIWDKVAQKRSRYGIGMVIDVLEAIKETK